jgi:hypothetical protein
MENGLACKDKWGVITIQEFKNIFDHMSAIGQNENY